VKFYFLDSSAIVKRYISEIGSDWIQQLTHEGTSNQLFVARITWVEVLSALSRRQREGFLDSASYTHIKTVFKTHLNQQYRILDIDNQLLNSAGDLVSQYPLRAYDSVQLTAALRLKSILNQSQLPDPIFLTADKKLFTIAQQSGLLCDNPSNHP
jgi:uncharacterized protein